MLTRRSLITIPAALLAQGDEPTFRGGVAVVRVDVQVLNGNSAVTGLTRDDFVVQEQGQPQAIRYFGSEELPLDLLLLLDVSISMAPHVSRVVEEAHGALGLLRPGDRVGAMVFDREARLRLPYEGAIDKVRDGLDEALHRESFRGGTDIHFGLYEAAKYVRRHARPGARRAVIILTDDRTERARKDALVLRGFNQADAVLCSLVVDLKKNHGDTEKAGVESLSAQTGGDSFRATNAADWFRTTLERLRLRYALGFHLPEGLTAGTSRLLQVDLSSDARQRNPRAVVQARKTYIVPDPPPMTSSADASPVARSGPSSRQ